MPWDPNQYEKFQSERSAPFFDLLELVDIRDDIKVIDLGCGTGELTSTISEKLPTATILGIDSSESMLAKSEEFAGQSLEFKQSHIEGIGGKWDLLISNAAIQWVEDHEQLIPRLITLLEPGGQIAIQLPSNHTHYSHKLILELAQSPPYEEALGGWKRIPPVLTPERYAQILFDQGLQEIIVFEKLYSHVLADADAIADWTSGTALVPYFEKLPADLRNMFMDEYRAGLRKYFPQSPVFYPFKRILFSAKKSI
jgi:trans-aconitate 2-methyltransferase